LLLSSWVCPCRQTHYAHLWLQHRTSAHFEIGMLVMFAPASSNLSQVAPWQQHGLKIEWASLKDSVAKQIVTAAFMPFSAQPDRAFSDCWTTHEAWDLVSPQQGRQSPKVIHQV
jgi:hypothetical protein